MGHTIFWHMVWKEYRQQLGLFLALAIGTVVLHGIIAWGASLRDHPLPITAVYHVVLIMPIFYALGCGATLFAGEREMETYSFLAALPQPRWSTFAAKTSVALLSTILLSLVCLATAYVVAQGRWPGTSDAPPVADYALITLEVLAWSSLCSLLLKNPLVAVAAAGAVYFSALLTLKVLCSLANGPTPSGDLLFYIARAATLAVVAFTAGKFGARWIQSESVWSVARWDRRQGLATASEFTQPATRRGMLVRLVWQSWQQSRAQGNSLNEDA
jgi:ABC-type transport system involved in multi-copper enzyme maturation permease subunit